MALPALIKKRTTMKLMEITYNLEQVGRSRLDQVDFDNLPFGRVFSDHMIFMDYDNGKWEIPNIIPYDNFLMSPASTALHYGQSIFEGMKAELDPDGKIVLFRPELNVRRFNKTARRMAMPEIPEKAFLEYLKALVILDRTWIPTKSGYSLYIRPFMFANDEYIGIRISDNYRFVIFTCPVGPYYSKPVKVFIEDHYVRAFKGGTGDAKAAGNYGATLYPLKHAKKAGYDQIMWTDGVAHKYIQEIGTMNVFFVIDDQVITPNLDGTILEGTTRASLIQLFKDRGQEVVERQISVDEVRQAHFDGKLQDAFGSGTAATVIPISHFGTKDEMLELPAPEDRHWSNLIKKDLIDYKRGVVEDRHNWLVKI